MTELKLPLVSIVDYGLGNTFSIKHACEKYGLRVQITSSAKEIEASAAVILPGVGAFGEAMKELKRKDLVSVLLDVAASEKYFIGICLGMQLFMKESFEYGHHLGLGIIDGSVKRLEFSNNTTKNLKVPHVGWNRISPSVSHSKKNKNESLQDLWRGGLLEDLPHGEKMYFVHSYYTIPENKSLICSITEYGNIQFCSTINIKNIWGFQFHPERSGPSGLLIYKMLANKLCLELEEK